MRLVSAPTRPPEAPLGDREIRPRRREGQHSDFEAAWVSGFVLCHIHSGHRDVLDVWGPTRSGASLIAFVPCVRGSLPEWRTSRWKFHTQSLSSTVTSGDATRVPSGESAGW